MLKVRKSMEIKANQKNYYSMYDEFVIELFKQDPKWYLHSRVVSIPTVTETFENGYRATLRLETVPYEPSEREIELIEQGIRSLKEQGIL
jgi:hypothetical protein